MNYVRLVGIFRSKYCIIIFILSAILGYILVPKKIFSGAWIIIGIIYIILFSLVITCIARTIKEKVVNAKNTGASLISIIASIFGIGALQVCGIGAPVCGATIGVGIMSIIFPHTTITFFEQHHVGIIIISLILQIVALYYMGCFKKCLQTLITRKK